MLQKLTERVGFWTANVLSSLLFVAIHVPGWMALRTLSVGNAAFVFIFGAIMATAFRASGSLWAPIASHSANDFLSFVVFGR
jgi:membrane protease YdiL (CAAX protease family)